MKTLGRRCLANLLSFVRDERGLGLVSTLVAVAILGLTASYFVATLSVGSEAVSEREEETIAQGLARTQMEYAKNYSYDKDATTYPQFCPDHELPQGYTITVEVIEIPDTDEEIQKIKVIINRDDVEVLILEGYKVDRW